ncbi:MAG: hypothetical protein P4L16_01260 [Chlamydiales bacterium]|nr:hypothetical protein [Chlamydiales bacterium]
MILFIKNFFTEHWQRKLVAILSALIIWFLVNNSITITRTITNIPVRVINLPANKTIEGLLPSGFLKKRFTLTLSGNRDIIQSLDSSDLQVVIDAKNREDQWIAKIDKKSILSLNPEIDLSHSISDVAQNEFLIRLSPLITEKIPIHITKPIGNPPPGYHFLDIWPQFLAQTVSGPEQQMHTLQAKGLELTFDLSKISAADLDALHEGVSRQPDEVSYFVPNSWKYVTIPFQDDAHQKINDPAAEPLRIDFLRSMLLPLDIFLPISIFFPLQTSSSINPKNDFLGDSALIEDVNGIPLLKMPLFAKDVSKLFLDIVRNNLEIIVIAGQKTNAKSLQWTIQFINPQALENAYVAEGMKENSDNNAFELKPELKEEHLRNRFRGYMRGLEFFTAGGKKLQLEIQWKENNILLSDASL